MRFRAIGCVAFLSLGCSDQSDEAKIRNQPPPVQVQDEALMRRAVEKARATQQQFRDALAQGDASIDRFAIKKAFPTPERDGDGEHIWLSKVTWDGEVYSANVDNVPVYTKEVTIRQRVTVKPEEISDWMYFENDELRGGYTLRVVFHEASPEEKAAMKRRCRLRFHQ